MFERYENELSELKAESLQRTLKSVEKEGKYIIQYSQLTPDDKRRSNISLDSSISNGIKSLKVQGVTPAILKKNESESFTNTYDSKIHYQNFSDGKKFLNLSSNDYLGIAENKEIINNFLKDADYSLGSASSRLLTGSGCVYHALEKYLAKIYQKDSALLFNSGYHANVGVMSTLLSKKDAVFSDKLNHASIIDGVRLSGADFYRYKHLDYDHLRSLLEKHSKDYENVIIMSESLFSMDGDRADFEKLIQLKKEFGAILIVDEAHAFGVYGENGLGVCENYRDEIDLIVATFGKAVGSMGAFCVGNGLLIEYLTNKSRPLIFSTALPEINIAFSYYVVSQIIPNMKEERKNLFETARKLSTKIKECGLETIGDSYIIPIILGSNENAVRCSNILMENGYYLLPIRHPTVARNSSRVRISLRADVAYEEVEQIAQIISQEKTCNC